MKQKRTITVNSLDKIYSKGLVNFRHLKTFFFFLHIASLIQQHEHRSNIQKGTLFKFILCVLCV